MNPRYSIIPAGAVTDPRIEPRDLQVLCLLGRHIDDLGWCRRSQVKMARELGCARSTLQGSLERLVLAQWVEIHAVEPAAGKGDSAHSYRVRLDVNESDSFYQSLPKWGRAKKAGGPDGQTENPADSSAPSPPADRSAPPVPPQERHPVPTYGSAPLTSPGEREDLRESARARESGGPPEAGKFSRWDFVPPDTAVVDATFDALAMAWERGAKGGRGAIGNTLKAKAALADLPEDEHAKAIERAPRFLQALKAANKYAFTVETYVKGREFDHHPPPASADPSLVVPVELKPYVKELWAVFWKALHKARQATGNEQLRRRLTDSMVWVAFGVTMPAGTIPTKDETDGLVPVVVDSPAFSAWQDYCTRVGVVIPKPDHVPVIFAPAAWPPTLPLTGLSPYRLALPVSINWRGRQWWWRLFKRIEDGVPIVSTMGKHRSDPIERARGSHGAEELTYGPIPLASEREAMVEVRTLTDAWEQWVTWFHVKGASIDLWPDSSIFCPTEFPSLTFGREKLDPAPDYEAIEAALHVDDEEDDGKTGEAA